MICYFEQNFVDIRFRESVLKFLGYCAITRKENQSNGRHFETVHFSTFFFQIIIIYQWCNFDPKISLGKWFSEVGSIGPLPLLGSNGWEVP